MELGPVGCSEKRKENNINYRIVQVNEQYFVWEAEESTNCHMWLNDKIIEQLKHYKSVGSCFNW